MKNIQLTQYFGERGDSEKMNTMSPIRKDFLASHLRSQLDRLTGILNNIEEEVLVDAEYTSDSLKQVELNLRQIRKLCLSN